jgi:type IV pilus assembly protein PilA
MSTPSRPPNPYASPSGRPGFGRGMRPMSAAQIYRRPTLVTVLAVLNFIGAPITLLMGFFMIYMGQTDTGAEMPGLMTGIGAVYLVLGVMSLLIAIGLWNLRSYGRTLQIISSCIGLLAIPFGTIISALILWYFFKPGVKVLFSEKPVPRLSAWEIEEVSKLSQSSAATVVLLAIVLPLVLVAIIGIIAAIAIPSLLRARVSANEASAIGDARQVLNGQYAYAQRNGGHYDTPECLAAPAECIPGYGVDEPAFLSGTIVGTKAGYQREFYPGPPAAENDVAFANLSPTSMKSFAYTAHPVNPGVSGVRGFCADSTGIICVTMDGSQPVVVDAQCASDCTPLQ